MEKESCYRIPKFDIYSTGNHGCLEEMSIAQLREALFQAKEWGKQEEERKRQDVRAMQEKVSDSKFVSPNPPNHDGDDERPQTLNLKNERNPRKGLGPNMHLGLR